MNKTFLTLEQLKEWRVLASNNGAQEAYTDMVLQWAEACVNAYAESMERIDKLEKQVASLNHRTFREVRLK